MQQHATRPAISAFSVTLSDTVDLKTNSRALYIGTSGDVRVNMESGETVTFKSVPVGIFPIQVSRVYATGTTASNIVAIV